MELKGVSLIGGKNGTKAGAGFRALNPATDELLEPPFFSASIDDVDDAAHAAYDAFAAYSALSGRERARFLRSIADRLESVTEELAERAHQESALPAQPRLQGEVKRAATQFRVFAELIEEGSWVAAHIDAALPDRKPLPRPEIGRAHV